MCQFFSISTSSQALATDWLSQNPTCCHPLLYQLSMAAATSIHKLSIFAAFSVSVIHGCCNRVPQTKHLMRGIYYCAVWKSETRTEPGLCFWNTRKGILHVFLALVLASDPGHLCEDVTPHHHVADLLLCLQPNIFVQLSVQVSPSP